MRYEGQHEPPLILEPRDPEPEAPPRLDRKVLIGGIAAACILGLGLGLAAKPELLVGKSVQKPAAVVAPAADGQIDIVMADPPPVSDAPVTPSGPLETMSQDLIQAAPRPPEPVARPRTPERAAPIYVPRESADESGVDAVADAPPPRRARAARASFDCGRARSYAEQMVCEDPALAAADRQLARAYQRAIRSGAPVDLLRAEQSDWIDIREDAAQTSPRALASVYDQRIEELNEMADIAQRGW